MGARTDIVYKTSANDGLTWSPLHVLYSEWQPPGHSWHAYTKNATFDATHQYWARDGWLDYRVPSPLPTQNLTLANAEALCTNSTQCFGFEFFDVDRVPPPSVVLCVTFRLVAKFTADIGNVVTLHNPAPVVHGHQRPPHGRAGTSFSLSSPVGV